MTCPNGRVCRGYLGFLLSCLSSHSFPSSLFCSCSVIQFRSSGRVGRTFHWRIPGRLSMKKGGCIVNVVDSNTVLDELLHIPFLSEIFEYTTVSIYANFCSSKGFPWSRNDIVRESLWSVQTHDSWVCWTWTRYSAYLASRWRAWRIHAM